MVLHIQLNLTYGYVKRNAQVKFEFCHGSMIFCRVMPFIFEKKEEIFSSHSLSSQHIQFKLKIWICNKNALVNFEFGYGLTIADRVIPLEL
jgi:hypothetical protein